MHPEKPTTFLLILIFLFASTGPITSTLYLPSLINISSQFKCSISIVQFTVTLFFLGYGFARLTYGIASDKFGRKPPLIFGLSVFFIGTAVCYFASQMDALLLGRFLQGLGVGGSNVLARIILRDHTKSKHLPRYYSYYSMVNITTMIATPVIGGYLQQYYGWQSNFLLLLAYSLIILFFAIFFFKESNQHLKPDAMDSGILSENFKLLFSDKNFVIFSLLLLLAYGCMASWLTAGPIILQDNLNISPIDFGWYTMIVGVAFLFGAYINSKIVQKLGIIKMIFIGCSLILLGGVLLLIPILFFNVLNVTVFIIPVMVSIAGISMVIPNAYAQGVSGRAKIAGITVALLSAIQMIGGSLFSGIISFAHEHNQIPLGCIFLCIGLTGLYLLMKLNK